MRTLITLLIIGFTFSLLIFEGKMNTFNGFDVLLIALAIINSINKK